MSLINDALKRAKETHQGLPPQAILNSPMEPVHSGPKSHLPLILGVLLCVVFIGAGVVFWKMAHASEPAHKAASAPKPVVAITAAKPKVETAVFVARSNPPASVVKAPVNSAPTNPPAAAPVIARPTPAPVAVVATPAPQPAPKTVPAPVVAEVKPAVAPTPAAAPAPVQAKAAPVFPDLRLKAIVYSPTRPIAVINNASLSLGDEISGARLIKIEPRKVTLKWNNQTRELLLD